MADDIVRKLSCSQSAFNQKQVKYSDTEGTEARKMAGKVLAFRSHVGRLHEAAADSVHGHI